MPHAYSLRVFTRDADPACCPDGLARSIHMAVREDGGPELVLNRRCGILFASALITEEDCIAPRCLKEPRILPEADGSWHITAVRVLEDGTDEPGAPVMCGWRTRDFCSFEPAEPAPLTERRGEDRVSIPETVWRGVLRRWHQETGWPFGMNAACPEGLPRPLLRGYGDPVLLRHGGKYYFVATNDNTGNIGLYIRSGSTLREVFGEESREKLLLGVNEKAGLVQTFWAPEFHRIGGSLYLFFAVSGKKWGPQCHVMRLKDGFDAADPSGWTAPVPVVRRDGSPLADGERWITLDMTCVRADRLYAVWSCRRDIGTPEDTGSMLYIAELNEAEPWRLASEPVLLSRPLFGWENVSGTINNEGPYALAREGRVWLAYSAGAANGYTYAVGLLTASAQDDLLCPSAWRKEPAPVLSFASVPGEYGPGHCSFFTDAAGEPWILYHYVEGFGQHERCITMHRIRFPGPGESGSC